MKSSKFAYLALVMGFLVFVQALIVFVDISESNPLAYIAFTVVLLTFLPEYLTANISQHLGFPIVLPALTVIFMLLSFYRKEDKKVISIIGLSLAVTAISLYLALASRYHML